LQHHSQNTQRIIAYLSYLRDISRKIISRNGFEKCLLNKSLGFAYQFEQLELQLKVGENQYEELNRYFSFLQKNHDKKLFLGFGTAVGTRKRIFAAPILVIQCEISKDENSQTIIIEPDLGTLNLNYDFISALSTNYSNEEDDVLNPLTEDENRVVEEIEIRIKDLDDFDILAFSKVANEIFDELNKKITHFNNIKIIPFPEYNFKEELAKYSFRPPRVAKGNGERKKNRDENEKSIFEKDLVFINANHLFVSVIPDQLSTYEALNTFVQSINEENDFKNPVVEKLLANALTDERVEIARDIIEDEIQEVIDAYIPLSLSNSQIQGLKNAWANEISYIQGPPGTGKSHTISALVLSAIALNKKVLVISQKTAALNVVNRKIEPFLSDGDGIIGICYYDKSARKKIKDYCNYLLTQTSNTSSFKRNITTIKNRLQQLESDLNLKLKEVRVERQKLDKALDNQRHHKDVHETFLTELTRLNTDFTEIPKGFQFKKIKDESKYSEALTRIENLWELNANTLSSTLYIHKFKNHLKTKFNTPESWLTNTTFPYFSKSFIKLNTIFTEVQNIAKGLNADANSIRKIITNLKKDISIIQKQLIKLKYKLNVFENIKGTDYQYEIDKFDRMLYNTNSRLIDKKMKEINFHKITDVIPFWTAEIRNIGHLFPLTPDQFDLVVVDEASQVNLAEILPAFYRGKRICIVGDHKQLSLKASGLNFSLSKNFDELTWEKYNRQLMRYQTGTKKKLTVTQASILDFIKSEEYQATIREVMLDEHFRSLPQLARYTSKQFYRDEDNPDGKLKVMTEVPDKISNRCFKAVRVSGKRTRNEKGETTNKAILAEAEEVVKIIEGLILSDNQSLFASQYTLPSHIDKYNFSIGVISMIRDQCELIRDLLRERFPNSELDIYGIDVEGRDGIGTPEEFQGNERDIMIFTLCLDTDCRSGQGHYQDVKRLNVATSRAKSFTYFVYSPFPKTFDKIYNYLNYINGKVTDDDFAPVLDEFVKIELPAINYDLFESDFERYVHSYLERFINEHSAGQKITLHNQIKSCGQKRLDFVLFNHDTNKSVAIEVDGSHHFVSNALKENYTLEHVERMDILTRAGWNIINTPYHKWYKDGWLSEERDNDFKIELERIFNGITSYIF
jgi:superfamily I DNA and/or RNA helicase